MAKKANRIELFAITFGDKKVPVLFLQHGRTLTHRMSGQVSQNCRIIIECDDDRMRKIEEMQDRLFANGYKNVTVRVREKV